MKRSKLLQGYLVIAVLIGSILYYQKGAILISSKSHELVQVDRKSQLQNHIAMKKATIGQEQFKFDNPNEFSDYHWGIRTRKSELGPGYVPGGAYNELLKAKRNRYYRSTNSVRISDLEWKERGPSNVPGRTRGIIVLPGDNEKNTWLAGSVGGGIWKTIDGGLSWVLKTPDIPSLAITWLALCESQPEIIYASTGEAIGGGRGIVGNGVLKSVDSGETWTVLPSTLNKREFSIIGRIIVDPNDPDVLLICSSQGERVTGFQSGIYKSIDGGASWLKTHNSDAWISQIIADPSDFNNIYAAKWASGVLKSTNGGDTWSESSIGISKVNGRLEIAIAPSDPLRIYASAQGDISGANADLYVSFDGGDNWSIVDQKYNDQNIDFFRGQGDYDNTIAVNPYDEDEVYYGGVNLWKTRISENSLETELAVISVEVAKDSASYWDFVNFGGEYFNGKLEKGEGLADSKFVDVEVRTGNGKSQKAHRFTVNKQGSGVPDSLYKYEDYVQVPFEAWDMNNNRQLMVSFRDQQEDGTFNLNYQNTEEADEENHSREYIYIHNVDYADFPNAEIAQQGGEDKGHLYERMYFYWPILRSGLEWTPESLEPDTIFIDFDLVSIVKRFGDMTPVSDAYEDYVENLNQAYSQSTTDFLFHPDHHNLIMIPIDIKNKTFKILNTNDGGVFESNISSTPGVDDGDWISKGNGYNTGQFYGVAKKPGAEVYIGGLQDNGTWKSPDNLAADISTKYVSVWGGDGFDVLWNYINPEKYIVSVYNNRFYMTEDNGKTWFDAGQGIAGRKPFFSKLASSNSTPDIIYTVSSAGVYRSIDFGKEWTVTDITDKWGFSNFIDIKVSLANSNIVWAGSGMDDDLSLHVSTDGGLTFNKTNNYTDSELGFISGLATHPTEDSTAYALFSFSKGPKILRTEDLGQSWEDISGFLAEEASINGFPDVAVYCLLVRPDDNSVIWAGTEIGIFESLDNGDTWSFLENDMGAAAVWDMIVMDDEIVLATHGRGIFTATLPEPVEVTLAPIVQGYGNNLNGNLAINLDLRSTYDSTIIDINGVKDKLDVHPIGLLELEIFDLPVNDSLGVSITSYKIGKPYSTSPFDIKLFEVNEPVREYTDNFNEGTDDFVGDLFLITKFRGFDDFAIHTRHPYEEGINYPGDSIDYIYQLRTPIIVASSNATVKYEDIAVVEPGETGFTYPSQEFYDYVVAEASKDGISWTALGPGYDAKKNSKWLNAYNNNEDADKSMFVQQSFDLLEHFDENDTIFIRFKLHSDPLSVGWGWAIDNLSIQEKITGIKDDDFSEFLTIYPNPVEGNHANVSLSLEEKSQVNVRVFNVKGQIVGSSDFGTMEKGKYKKQLSVSNYPRGIYIVRFDINDEQYSRKIVLR